MKYWQALPLRSKVLFLALFLVSAIYVYSLVDANISERDLERIAQKEIDGIHDEGNDVAYEVTVSKEYVLFGKTHGKVQVFVRQKPPRQDENIHAVNFYYNREGGEWKSDGSAADAGEEVHQKGLRLFSRQSPAAPQAGS